MLIVLVFFVVVLVARRREPPAARLVAAVIIRSQEKRQATAHLPAACRPVGRRSPFGLLARPRSAFSLMVVLACWLEA